ncbi:MAG: SIMPL domain-containing protein [Methylohalobius crimeensis]
MAAERSSNSLGPWLLAAAVLLAGGIITAGYFIGDGFYQGRRAERYVTVKGLAERDVQADLAVWPLHFTVTDNDLASAQAKIEKDAIRVRDFLGGGGIAAEEIQGGRMEVVDRMAQRYQPTGEMGSRYIVTQTLVVRSPQVDRIARLSSRLGALVRQGVVLMQEGPEAGPQYLFTRLNEIKPSMLAEATRSARAAAAQFAADSGSRLAGLRRANQGVFVIQPRDAITFAPEKAQINKTVRIVSTLQYYLVDLSEPRQKGE